MPVETQSGDLQTEFRQEEASKDRNIVSFWQQKDWKGSGLSFHVEGDRRGLVVLTVQQIKKAMIPFYRPCWANSPDMFAIGGNHPYIFWSSCPLTVCTIKITEVE